jgi:hypothetical protein
LNQHKVQYIHDLEQEEAIMMSEEKPPKTEEQKKIDRRSFYIGIGIAIAIIVLYTVLYYQGLIK